MRPEELEALSKLAIILQESSISFSVVLSQFYFVRALSGCIGGLLLIGITFKINYKPSTEYPSPIIIKTILRGLGIIIILGNLPALLISKAQTIQELLRIIF